MRRRPFLAAVGLFATGGCLASDGGAGPEPETDSTTTNGGLTTTDSAASPTTDATIDNARTTDGFRTTTHTDDPQTPSTATVEIAEPVVQSGVVTKWLPDALTVTADAGQYLVIHATAVEGPSPDRTAFEFLVGDESFTPMDDTLHRRGEGRGSEYSAEDGEGWLAYGLPETVPIKEARLTWPDGEWTPPGQVRERLASPTPSFDVAFSAPDSVSEDKSVTLSIDVANEGETPGVCVFALNRGGPAVASTPARQFGVDVGAGERVTREFGGVSPYDAEEPARVTYSLHTSAGEEFSRTIEPVE